MRGREHFRLLHADRRELVDVEEAPVVDLLTRHAPERQPIHLRVEQPVEEIEASRIARRAVEALDGLIDEVPHVGRVAQERIEPPPSLLRARPARGLGVKRERREPREERLQLEHRRMLGAEGPVELLHAMADDPRVRARRDGQERVVVADAKAAALALEPELSRVEHGAVLIAEDRQQHLARELALHRVPVDVERGGVP